MKLAIDESVLRQTLKILERHPYSTELQFELAATALRTTLDAAEKVEPEGYLCHGTLHRVKRCEECQPLYPSPAVSEVGADKEE